VLFNQIIR